MYMKSRCRCPLYAILLLLGHTLTAESVARAQSKKPVLPAQFYNHVEAKYHQLGMKQVLGVLGSAQGLNVMIDGDPLVLRENVEFNGTVEEALNKIAGTFDYKWKVGPGGIVLFNKRFSNVHDAPQATLPEFKEMVNNIAAIFRLANVDPDPSQWPHHVDLLGQSLSNQQWATLLSRKRIAGRELSPEQFAHLRTAVTQNTFAAPTQQWAELAARLRALKTTYLIGHRLPDDPSKPGAPPAYDYEIVWHNRDGSLNSEPLMVKFFGNEEAGKIP